MHVDTKMKYVHALKVVYEGIELGPGKYGEFSAPPTIDLTYVIWRQFIGKTNSACHNKPNYHC